MKKLYYFLKLLANLASIAKNPNNTQSGINVADCLYKLGLLERELKALSWNMEARNFLAARKRIAPYDLKTLSQYPEGTLAQSYGHHMLSRKLQPDFYSSIPIVNDSTYIMMRMRETHDLWHVITGFETDVPGELGLQAFMFAQIDTPLAPILIGGRTLVAIFKNPEEVPLIYDQITVGWSMGKNAKSIFSLDWEAHWSTPLEKLRKDNGIISLAKQKNFDAKTQVSTAEFMQTTH